MKNFSTNHSGTLYSDVELAISKGLGIEGINELVAQIHNANVLQLYGPSPIESHEYMRTAGRFIGIHREQEGHPIAEIKIGDPFVDKNSRKMIRGLIKPDVIICCPSAGYDLEKYPMTILTAKRTFQEFLLWGFSLLNEGGVFICSVPSFRITDVSPIDFPTRWKKELENIGANISKLNPAKLWIEDIASPNVASNVILIQK